MSEHEASADLNLLAALREQAAAVTALAESIKDLAESNRQVVDFLIAHEDLDAGEALPQRSYLDGSACR